MTIVLRQGEINTFDGDARYAKNDPKELIQLEGRTYRVLTYARRLTSCECFMRGLAWALSCITIIPLLFCRAGVSRLLNEARTKTVTKTLFVPVDYQAKFEELKRHIESIKKTFVNPNFISVLAGQDFSLENYLKLKEWLKARDTLVVWEEIAREVRIAEDNLNISGFSSIEATVEKAATFADWCVQNADKTQKIIQLNFFGLELTNLPKEIGSLSQIKKLCLNNNQLRKLPKEIGNLSQLEYLSLKGNQLTKLPKEIGNLSQLKILYLEENRLIKLPNEIGSLSQLISLDLGSNQLSEVPKEIVNFSQLTGLYLCKNQLVELPIEIGNLSQLRGLNLGDNQLSKLPREIVNLSQLKRLNLYNNQLSELPKKIAKLSQLEGLHLYNNQLSELPKEIGKLSQLKDLCLGLNLLRSLPKEIGNLSRLNNLELRGNQLAELPEEIENLKRRGCRILR